MLSWLKKAFGKAVAPIFMSAALSGGAMAETPAPTQPTAPSHPVDVAATLSSHAGFMHTMDSLTPLQRQNVMDQLININPDGLTEVLYENGERNAPYEAEYDRALPLNKDFFEGKFFEIAYQINTMHDQPDNVRFEITDNFSAVRTYDTMTLGWPELYTSTFNGLFNRFLQKEKQENVSFFSIMDTYPQRLDKLTDFIEGVTTFERTSVFWASLKTDEKARFIDVLFANVERGNNNRYIYAVGSFMRGLPANDPYHVVMEQKIIDGYQSHTGIKKDIYAVLGRWYMENAAHRITPQHQEFFTQLAANHHYDLPDLDHVEGAKLFDAHGNNYQIHVFYEDQGSFKARMQADGWSVSNPDPGLSVISKRQGGRQIKIYAVTLEGDTSGLDGGMHFRNQQALQSIRTMVADEGGKVSVVVHRGHSYLSPYTMDALDDDTAMAFWGACGLTIYEEQMIGEHPDMQIAGTVGTGKGAVNNASLVVMEDHLLGEGQQNWHWLTDLWRKGGEDMQGYYVPLQSPVQELYGALILLKKDEAKPAPSSDPSLEPGV